MVLPSYVEEVWFWVATTIWGIVGNDKEQGQIFGLLNPSCEASG